MSLRWSTAGGFEVGLEEAQFDLSRIQMLRSFDRSFDRSFEKPVSLDSLEICQNPTGSDDRDDFDGRGKSICTYIPNTHTHCRFENALKYIKINKLRIKLSCLAKPWPWAFAHGRPDRVAILKKCAVTRTKSGTFSVSIWSCLVTSSYHVAVKAQVQPRSPSDLPWSSDVIKGQGAFQTCFRMFPSDQDIQNIQHQIEHHWIMLNHV